MNLFSDEIINISRIYTIEKFYTKNEVPHRVREFNPKLPTYELIFNFTGVGTVTFNNDVIYDRPLSLRYLPKGVDGFIYRVEKESDGECIDIYFDTPDPMPQNAMSLYNMEEIQNLFLKIYNIWSSKKTGYYIECVTILYEIIKRIKKYDEKYISPSQKEPLKRAYEYMIENYRNMDFDYRKMAEKSGLSYSYFKELFIKNYGIPPVKYVTRLKIEYATELLVTDRYSVGEIAEMCGFENVYYFSTVFKKIIGISPSKYKLR